MTGSRWPDPLGDTLAEPSTGTPTNAARPDRVRLADGAVLGERYEVRAFLGEGGMGAVYRAFDRTLDDEVALKLVDARYATHDGLRDEVRLAQRVTHKNVCRTYDLESFGDRHVVKMELVDGEPLATRLAASPRLAIPRAIAIARAIADGLAAAHAVGVVHRDLKPGNVMLAGDRVVLMDFGLAQRANGDRSDYAGTPGYMSPEQMAGATIDTRSDLYALGCVLYEMLAGKRLLGTGSFEELWRRQREAVPDVRADRADTPRWLARAVRALLARDPARRARGVTLLAHGSRSTRVLAASAVGAIVVAGAVAWAATRGGTWRPDVVPVLPQFVENADDPVIAPDDATIAYISDRGHPGVFATFVMPRVGGASRQVSPAGEDCVRPHWTHTGDALLMACGAHEHVRIFRQRLDGPARELLGDAKVAVACGADMVAVVTNTGRAIELWHGERHVALAGLAPTGDIMDVRCARDGSRLAYVQGDAVFAMELAPPRPPKQLAETPRTSAFGITPEGRSVVYVRTHGALSDLAEVTVDDGVVHPIALGDEHAYSPSVSPDGTLLVYDHDISSRPPFVIDANGGHTQLTVTLDHYDRASPSPRAGSVVLERDDGRVVIVDDHGAQTPLARGDRPFFDRTGDRVLFRDLRAHAQLLGVSASGGAVVTIAGLPGELVDGIEAADGIHVALDLGGVHQGWLVGADGHATREIGADGLVVPAPDGGWRAVLFDDGGDSFVRFVRPGESLVSGARVPRMPGRPLWLDARHFAYCDHAACHTRDVATGRETSTPHPAFADSLGVGPGGDHWYTTEYVGQVTRHVIANFASRPWAP